jgi:hypothetical protein
MGGWDGWMVITSFNTYVRKFTLKIGFPLLQPCNNFFFGDVFVEQFFLKL